MEKTLDEIVEGPVLLTWEMPAWKKKLFHSLPFAILAVLLLVNVFVVWPLYDRVYARAIGAFLLFGYAFLGMKWLMLPLWRSSAHLDVTTNGIRVKTVIDVRFVVPWTNVRVLRRGIWGFMVLSDPPGSIYLPIPPEVRDRLIAVLRETSNARIVGFGPEGC